MAMPFRTNGVGVRAVDLAVGERSSGPIFITANGQRLDRHGASRIVRRIARRAGVAKLIGPYTLRHASSRLSLDAGVPLRDVQEAASHANPRTTMRYDRARVSRSPRHLHCLHLHRRSCPLTWRSGRQQTPAGAQGQGVATTHTDAEYDTVAARWPWKGAHDRTL